MPSSTRRSNESFAAMDTPSPSGCSSLSPSSFSSLRVLFLKNINTSAFAHEVSGRFLLLMPRALRPSNARGRSELGLAYADSGGLVQSALDQHAATQAMGCLGTGQHGQVQQRLEGDDGHVGTAEGQN